MAIFVRLALILATAGIAMAQTGSEPSAQWQLFKSNAGRFQVEMPGAPKETSTKSDSFIGTITNHIFALWNDKRKFSVDYSDLPGLAVTFAGHDTIYSHTKGAVLKKTWSKETSYEDITVQGIKGKKLVYEMPPIKNHPPMHGQAYMLLDDHRLYVFDVELPVKDSERAAERFLSSIRIGK